MRKILTFILASILLLTGCGKNKSMKKLTCSEIETNTNYTLKTTMVFYFENEKLKTATMTYNTTLGDDYIKLLNTFIESYEYGAEDINKKNGYHARVEHGSNNVSLIMDIDVSKISENDIESSYLNENYEELKKRYTDTGFTCN